MKTVPVELVPTEDQALHAPAKVATLQEALPIVDALRYIIDNVPWGSAAGMAAPQIGSPYRVFIAQGRVFINPNIENRSKGTLRVSEGCFSLAPNKHYPVTRHESITMNWQDEEGNPHRREFIGYQAQVIQHEYDHIEGKLLI